MKKQELALALLRMLSDAENSYLAYQNPEEEAHTLALRDAGITEAQYEAVIRIARGKQ